MFVGFVAVWIIDQLIASVEELGDVAAHSLFNCKLATGMESAPFTKVKDIVIHDD